MTQLSTRSNQTTISINRSATSDSKFSFQIFFDAANYYLHAPVSGLDAWRLAKLNRTNNPTERYTLYKKISDPLLLGNLALTNRDEELQLLLSRFTSELPMKFREFDDILSQTYAGSVALVTISAREGYKKNSKNMCLKLIDYLKTLPNSSEYERYFLIPEYISVLRKIFETDF